MTSNICSTWTGYMSLSCESVLQSSIYIIPLKLEMIVFINEHEN